MGTDVTPYLKDLRILFNFAHSEENPFYNVVRTGLGGFESIVDNVKSTGSTEDNTPCPYGPFRRVLTANKTVNPMNEFKIDPATFNGVFSFSLSFWLQPFDSKESLSRKVYFTFYRQNLQHEEDEEGIKSVMMFINVGTNMTNAVEFQYSSFNQGHEQRGSYTMPRPMANDKWHYIAAVYCSTAGSLQFYDNGVGLDAVPLRSSAIPKWIKVEGALAKCHLADVALWTRCLSQLEIQNIHHEQVCLVIPEPPEPNVIRESM